jgi:hypothetical protein
MADDKTKTGARDRSLLVEMNRAAGRLGAKSDLPGLIGSWGGTS